MTTSSVVKKANIAGDDVCSLENLAYNEAPGTHTLENFHPRVTVDQAEGLCHRIT